MKKPVVNPPERNFSECKGAGFIMVDHPTRPGVKIYQECKECRGKDRTAAGLVEIGLKAKK
jgi:excinuclease UvrABC ATPase subunit